MRSRQHWYSRTPLSGEAESTSTLKGGERERGRITGGKKCYRDNWWCCNCDWDEGEEFGAELEEEEEGVDTSSVFNKSAYRSIGTVTPVIRC